MEKRLFYPAVHVTEVMERLGRNIDDPNNYSFSLQTLDDCVGGHYADRVLSGAVNAVAHRRDFGLGHVRFEWDAVGKYAPGIRFAAMSTDELTLDKNGYLSSPILCARADLVLPFLDFGFRGSTANALVAWGCYARTDIDGNQLDDINSPNVTDAQRNYCWRTGGGSGIIHNFCQCSTSQAGYVLVIVPWGGAYSETSGQSEKILETTHSFERGLEFFQQCSSNRGREGYDFYIIDIAKAVEAKAMEDFRRMLKNSKRRVDTRQGFGRSSFCKKYSKFQTLETEYKKFKEKECEIEKRLDARYMTEIKGSALAAKSCVVLPDKVGLAQDYLQIPLPPDEYTCTWEELREARIPSKAWDQLAAVEDKFNAIIDAWLDFAPLYVDMAEVIIQKCHGTAEVHLNCLKMAMPNTYVMDANVPGTGAYNERKYDFSETHLEACVKYVQNFLDDSRTKREANLLAIGKLAENDPVPEAPAE